MKRSRLNPMSKKRRRELRLRAKVRERVLERDLCCRGRAVMPDLPCAGPLAVHEVRRRAQDSSAWLNEDLCITLCSVHHEFAHHFPEKAAELGLLILRPDAQDGAA